MVLVGAALTGTGSRGLGHRAQLTGQAARPVDGGLLGQRVTQFGRRPADRRQQLGQRRFVQRPAGAQHLGQRGQHRAGAGQFGAQQRLRTGQPVPAEPVGIAGQHQDVAPGPDGLVQQHPIGLDAGPVIVTDTAKHRFGVGDRVTQRRAGAGVDRVGRHRRQLLVQRGQCLPLRPVPAQRPAGDRQHRLHHGAGQHQQPGADRRLRRLREVPQDQGTGGGGHAHLRGARAYRQQQPGREGEHRQQHRRGEQVVAEGRRQPGGHRRRQPGQQHPEDPQPVRPGPIGERGLQRADGGQHAHRGAAQGSRDHQRDQQATGVASRHHRIGLAQVDAGRRRRTTGAANGRPPWPATANCPPANRSHRPAGGVDQCVPTVNGG